MRSIVSSWLGGVFVGVLLFLATGYVLRACWSLPTPIDVLGVVGLVVLIVAAHTRLPASDQEILRVGGGLIPASLSLAGLLGCTALIIGINALAAGAMAPTFQQTLGEASAILPRTPSAWMRHIVYAVVFAPVVEELSARGWVQGSMKRHMHPALAVAAAAALFAFAHSIGAGRIVFPLGAFLFGVFAGTVVLVTGTVWAAVALHTLANCINTAGVASGAYFLMAESAGASTVLGSALVLSGVVTLWRVYGVLRQGPASLGMSRGVA